jgi:hypothetical protein
MPRGGLRQGAGRKAGAPNKATQARQAKAAAEGILPIDVMLGAMRDLWEGGRKTEAAAVAKDAAPYIHPRLQAITNSAGDGPAELLIGWLPPDV